MTGNKSAWKRAYLKHISLAYEPTLEQWWKHQEQLTTWKESLISRIVHLISCRISHQLYSVQCQVHAQDTITPQNVLHRWLRAFSLLSIAAVRAGVSEDAGFCHRVPVCYGLPDTSLVQSGNWHAACKMRSRCASGLLFPLGFWCLVLLRWCLILNHGIIRWPCDDNLIVEWGPSRWLGYLLLSEVVRRNLEPTQRELESISQWSCHRNSLFQEC